jgi:two-component system, chemotaxis family, sensor kinase CheA
MTQASAAAGIDLTPFHAPFFEEARENLDRLEQLLLGLDAQQPETETLHAVFRCAHSVKGGAAAFGFADTAQLTHAMETLLDRLRRAELAPSATMVDLLLRAADLLRAQLAAHAGAPGSAPDAAQIEAELQQLAGGDTQAAPGLRHLRASIGPLHDAAALAGLAGLVELFDEIPGLGSIEPLTGVGGDGVHCFAVHTGSSEAELLDLFSFHVEPSLVRLQPLRAASPSPSPSPPPPPPTTDASSLRVALDKVDQLVNLVGELVITQAMIAQACTRLDPAAQRTLATGFADLERHTRQLQDAVMAIRMIPMGSVFARYPRLLRDLGATLGKQFRLVTEGGATELDKGLIEKITDPLTHLVRNGCDHGIEPPAERVAAGKPEAGTVTLAAMHQGGTVLIEVRDDGRGLSREALLHKARERGLAAPDTLRDDEVWQFVFLPGLSTAAQLSEVSGRGVGMDVVHKTIAALGGQVEIESTAGQGTTVRVRLPLTLAIMDGLLLRAADECYVLPLSAVLESMPHDGAALHTLGEGDAVLSHRDVLLPVRDLGRLFDVPRAAAAAPERQVLVIVEAEGARCALRVDELLGQQQVVVKNLETHYTRVPLLAGATILGDGRVALILDAGALVRHQERRRTADNPLPAARPRPDPGAES